VIFLLVCAGATERPNATGLLPTHKAAFSGAASALDMLLAHSDNRHANAALLDGMTPLHLAAWKVR
jgi:ankyrin repeat protein